MIAYDQLAAALDRWRIRNGLPANPPLFADARGSTPPPPPGPRATQAIAAVPPPAPVAPPPRSPPPPPSGRTTLFGMPAATVVAPPPTASIHAAALAEVPPAPPDDGEVGDAEVLEESGDPYDNEGSDFAVAFGSTAAGAIGEGDEATRVSGGAAPAADAWPEAHTVATHGWGQAPAKPAETVEADDEATHIGDPARRN